ncbi:MAG: hypothetical protein MJY83_06165 [Bacteroidales bacterium]|nr:hypothetical protein [Bacteroidales bacterium]
MKKTFAEILSEQKAELTSKMSKKVPEWSGYTLEYPSKLCTEQCSSSATARYKASLLERVASSRRPQMAGDTEGCKPRIADITGGLGVDCWAFSQIAEAVLHNEMNTELSEAVRKNFEVIGIQNTTFSSICITEEAVDEALASFRPTIIFTDPARREAGTGKKVFRLEDCTPDILSLKDKLLSISENIVMKISPMADISLVCKSIGDCVREVHVLGTGGASGECKELIIWMQRDWHDGYSITVADTSGASISFSPLDESSARMSIAASIAAGSILLEPSAALMKAGCFSLLSDRFSLAKLGTSTHLYVSDGAPEELAALCKRFRILEVLPFSGSAMKSLSKEYPRADVTARNIPMTSDQLRVKLRVAPGDGLHIFGCHSDRLGRLLLVTERI